MLSYRICGQAVFRRVSQRQFTLPKCRERFSFTRPLYTKVYLQDVSAVVVALSVPWLYFEKQKGLNTSAAAVCESFAVKQTEVDAPSESDLNIPSVVSCPSHQTHDVCDKKTSSVPPTKTEETYTWIQRLMLHLCGGTALGVISGYCARCVYQRVLRERHRDTKTHSNVEKNC